MTTIAARSFYAVDAADPRNSNGIGSVVAAEIGATTNANRVGPKPTYLCRGHSYQRNCRLFAGHR